MEVRELWGEGQGHPGGRGRGGALGWEKAQAVRSKRPVGLAVPGTEHSKVFWRLPGPVQATHQNTPAVSQAARNASLKTRVSLPGSTDRRVWPVRRSAALRLAVTGWTLCGAAVTAGQASWAGTGHFPGLRLPHTAGSGGPEKLDQKDEGLRCWGLPSTRSGSAQRRAHRALRMSPPVSVSLGCWATFCNCQSTFRQAGSLICIFTRTAIRRADLLPRASSIVERI